MNQQSARFGLRAIILLSAFIGVVAIAVAMADESLLPKELAEWKASQEVAEEGAIVVGLILVLPLVVAWIAGLVGMFMFHKWGAWLTLGASLLASLFLLVEPNVESGLSYFFSDLGSTLNGATLGIAFFSKALEPDEPNY